MGSDGGGDGSLSLAPQVGESGGDAGLDGMDLDDLSTVATGTDSGIGQGMGLCVAGSMEETSVFGFPPPARSVCGNSFLVNGTSDMVESGQYVEIVLTSVPIRAHTGAGPAADALATLQCAGGFTALFGLLRHENKLSVLHFNVSRLLDDDDEDDGDCKMMGQPKAVSFGGDAGDVIKSKDELIFHTGFRSFNAKPVYSESNLNCDKHKFERFLMPGRFAVASVYGPITFLPCPVLVFKALPDGSKKLVATGSLGSVDPDRISLKKVILTGYPMRIKKKFAVVKHMFYQAPDVRWFKPAELATKHGLRGNIRESLGNKGLFKAVFSAPIKQNDTVMLILYKRVFPKLPEAITIA